MKTKTHPADGMTFTDLDRLFRELRQARRDHLRLGNRLRALAHAWNAMLDDVPVGIPDDATGDPGRRSA